MDECSCEELELVQNNSSCIRLQAFLFEHRECYEDKFLQKCSLSNLGRFPWQRDGLAAGCREASRSELLQRIETCFMAMDEDLFAGKIQSLPIVRRNWGGKPYALHMVHNSGHSVGQFLRMKIVLEEVRKLLVEDQRISIRALYYENIDVFLDMAKINRAISAVAALLCVPRVCMRISPGAKGLVAGMVGITIDEYGSFVDCRSSAQLISSSCKPALLQNSLLPRAIIVCEKEAVFYTLYYQRVWERLNCVIISGKGIPDVGTLRFLRMLKGTFPGVPTYAVVDCNPCGVVILNCYKHGASSAAGIELEKENLADSSLRWIGLHTRDAQKVQQRLVKNLTHRDRAILQNLLENSQSHVSPSAILEIEHMREWGKKADIEAAYTLMGRKSFGEWLVSRIVQKMWIA